MSNITIDSKHPEKGTMKKKATISCWFSNSRSNWAASSDRDCNKINQWQ